MNIRLGDNNINVKIIYKRNKNIYFRFDDDLNLTVTCPKNTLNDEIMRLISKNEDGILKMYEKALEKKKYDDSFYLLGKLYNVSYTPDLDDVQINEDVIYVKDDKQLNKYVLEETNRVFNEEIDICKRCFASLPEFSLKIRKMKTRWGVCNTRDKIITLNSELIKKDVKLIDYVIIHEMAHFFEGNHSKKFWSIVESACPKYKERRKELRK